MNESNEFTETERYLIALFRSRSDSNWVRGFAADGAYLTVSVVFVILALRGGDPTWGILAFLILVYRLIWGMWQNRRWIPAIQSIISKYAAQLEELSAATSAVADASAPLTAEQGAAGKPPGSLLASDGSL